MSSSRRVADATSPHVVQSGKPAQEHNTWQLDRGRARSAFSSEIHGINVLRRYLDAGPVAVKLLSSRRCT